MWVATWVLVVVAGIVENTSSYAIPGYLDLETCEASAALIDARSRIYLEPFCVPGPPMYTRVDAPQADIVR